MKWSQQEVGLQRFLKELTKIFVKTIDKESCQCYSDIDKKSCQSTCWKMGAQRIPEPLMPPEGLFGPRMRKKQKKKGSGRMQAARSFKTYQDISGGMNVAIIQSFKGVPLQAGHQPDGAGKAGGGVQADYQPD